MITLDQNYGNGITEGICSSIFPLSPSISFSDPPPDADGEQSTDCRSQSADACASIPDIISEYPTNNRKNTEIQMNEGNRTLITTINRTD
ncbi:MAG: hypothetical protein WBL67_12120 [Nitrososphaeraceae archaeon]